MLKRDQAAAFGRCLSHVMADDLDNTISELRRLAALETKVREEIAKA
jgi:hypothetical protein